MKSPCQSAVKRYAALCWKYSQVNWSGRWIPCAILWSPAMRWRGVFPQLRSSKLLDLAGYLLCGSSFDVTARILTFGDDVDTHFR